MDFSGIKHIILPQGAVSSIHLGETRLWQNRSLPEGYQQLTCIETDGNQYIDTGVTASNYPSGLQYRFQGCITGYAQTAGNNYLFGCLHNSRRSGNISANTSSSENALCLYIGGNSYKIWEAPLPETGKDFVITLTALSSAPEKLQAHIDGVEFTKTSNAVSVQMPEANIYLLWCKGVGSASKPFCGKLYSFTIDAANGTPIRCFVPCCRVADNVIGLYDTVEGLFYENAGTGSFLTGEKTV